MALYAVTRERGPAYDASRPLREQPGWDEHAAFMEALTAEGFIRLGGPVGDRGRVLHVVQAPDEQAIRRRLAADPWEPVGVLRTTAVEPWELLLEAPGATLG